MIFTAAGLVNEAAIESAVRKIEKEFSPDVVHINHSFGDDSTGARLFFFASLCATRRPRLLVSRDWRDVSPFLS
jgi:hypothetical protein